MAPLKSETPNRSISAYVAEAPWLRLKTGGANLAGLIAIWELRENRQATRVAEALDLLDTWEQNGYLAAFRRLDAEVSARLDTVPSADIEAACVNPLFEERLYERIAEDVLREQIATRDFEDLVYFFQRLSICIEGALCAHFQGGNR